jgi:predicted SnoaL-like aldol condensation-catalyzing enzyme
MTNKELVLTAITAVFCQRDLSALDKYFDPNYIQHNPALPNGTEILKQIIPALPEDFKYEVGTITENEDTVMIHGRFSNWNGKNYIAVDIFKVKHGKLAEHWDVLQEEVEAEKTVTGNTMFPIS